MKSTKPHGLRMVSDLVATEIVAMRSNGMMLKDIAAHFGISTSLASNVACKRRAYSGKPRKAYDTSLFEPLVPIEVLPKLDEFCAAGISIAKIAKLWGMSSNTIIRARDRVGIYGAVA